ncbi:ubiquitin carboxyl-terminal hydrolase 23 isoform X1 [Nicotiana tomentosiformis]|uniref:ubiquitin carboxyl-terminal hydrolase 23 isoform X1 n=1 Tax=Nicotiana tomentosiformis TaxID=4098 RepID=UPI00051B562C|nr:ubiquitin carboxyl-terminal hydrolase 23 isoform X1 [Nicotiana tomentosiformis]
MGEAIATMNQMEENLGPQLSGLVGSDPGTDTSSLFHRRIEFHLARKPFSGFISNGGFQLETLNPNSEKTGKDNGLVVGGGKKVCDAQMESNGLDPEVSFGIAFRKIMRIGAGLQNLGNTCFLNSVLQCLTYTEPLAAYLESGKHQNSCRMAGFCALCAIQKHVSRALQATGKILAPKDLVSNLRCISRNFRNARQEDAHEYMVNLLESMHKCCLPSGVPSESPSAYDKSLVHKIFGGRLRSQVQCMQCNFCSDKFDPFLDLSLEILKADSLQRALQHFTARELLDGGQRQYQCQQCKQKVKATKRLTIDKAPHVLTIHLKRFGSHVPGQKIDKKIHYGPTLDLKHFVSDTYGGESQYTLYGVLVHAGWSTHSGHYYCFVRTSSGNWYSLDDNQVVQVSERKVLEQKAYMLFYVRDRKSPAPKKSVDVACNDNVTTNGIGNKMYSNHSQRFKDTVQNGIHVKNVNSFSGAKDQRETLCSEVSKETLTKGLAPPKVNGVVTNGSSSLGGAVQQEKSKVQETGERANESSVVDTRGGPCLLKANPTAPVSNGIHRLENKGETRCKDSNPLPNGNVKELTCSAAIPFSSSTVNNESLHKQEECSKGNTNSRVVKDISNGSFGDSAVNNDVGQRKAGAKSSGALSQPTMASSTEKEAIDKACLKAKKKSFKSRVTKMHLSFMILDPALGLHRKKKHKRMKHKIGKKKCCDASSVNENNVSSDLGPSTSELSHTLISSPMHSERKRKKSKVGSNEKPYSLDTKTAGHNGDLLRSTVDDVRVLNNGTVLANDKQPQKSSSSASVGNQGSDNKQSTDAKETKGVTTQKGLVNMLTRGLESSVARWDDVEVPSLNGVEAQNGNCVSIGYIGDEWDEEYDRGKRKKVRNSKIEFGGPNPFQEIASKKAKVKKASLGRCSSANQPFRIL